MYKKDFLPGINFQRDSTFFPPLYEKWTSPPFFFTKCSTNVSKVDFLNEVVFFTEK